MLKRLLSVSTLVLISYFKVSAQITPLEKTTHQVALTAVEVLNKKMTDSLYSIAGGSIRKTIFQTGWQGMSGKRAFSLLPRGNLTLVNAEDSLNKNKIYKSDSLLMNISVGENGFVTIVSILRDEQKTAAIETSDEVKRVDSVARRMLRLINEKKTDSSYLLLAENFRKQMSPDTWKNFMEKSIYLLLPFTEFTFLGNANNISKYKSGIAEFLISIDRNNKIETFRVQPYKEEVTKKFKSDNPLKEGLDSAINNPLSSYMKIEGNVGLSVGIYYDGKDHYFNYGETRLGNSLLPTNHTLYDIGSITKTFTSTLLALAVNEGKVKLSSLITDFLPDSVATNATLKGITLLQLANHTSGLPKMPTNWEATATDLEQPYANYDTKHLFSYLKSVNIIPSTSPRYEYSNTGVGLLGVILERIYKAPYADLVNKYISKPVKLQETKFSVNGPDTTLLAQGYDASLSPVAPWEFKAMQAIGVLKSSATDMLNYGKLQLSDASTPLSKAIKLTHELTYKDNQTGVGLGWHFLAGNPKIIWHNGATGGYRSLVCVDLERQVVVVVLTNKASNGDILGFDVLKALNTLK